MQDKNNHFRDIPKNVGAVTVLALIGAFLSRWHGGGFIGGSPKILKAFLWSFPFAATTWLAYFLNRRGITDWLQNTERLSYYPFNYVYFDIWLPIVVSAIVLLICMVFKNTGHGGGMDLAHTSKEPGAGRTPEKLEYLILWAHGKIPQYWYDVILLAIIGLAAVSGAALAVGVVNPLAGLVIALGGVLKALAYMVGWSAEEMLEDAPENFNEPTEIGEALTGLFAYSALAFGFFMVAL